MHPIAALIFLIYVRAAAPSWKHNGSIAAVLLRIFEIAAGISAVITG